ncbi:leucyl/phenylalanyl-tRNA--protein transferase [Flavobacterium sp. MAH-1]|uniref:Leucyl/phenylalanyl-tRNA--protein transferase n=1 Tax=Flavobacterium agri TaxID=2743471 RepID=A0A7Y9C5S2_9FLAO|nr:leucyl/phenylalanyl-tRNA--protein transferase [Flavobacterium agri]NUY81557.1 leucyl/phenylalanyl-tRNA--protein transferase [Flavobacterium agri]NYA71581.1 leucyl/phenylalanyl-tRNA--protein transferase [Flavobacterium agri]
MYFLSKELIFPDPDEADYDGLLAIGGDLSTERLLLAYQNGIFPWFDEDDPILWWSPDPRMVLLFDNLVVSKSMKSILRKGIFEITFNQDFEGVISNCQKTERKGQSGTWLTDEMKEAYLELHRLGYAKSVETWQDGELVGGLYGIDLGHVFCGESMFSKVSNASKAAFITLAKKLQSENYRLIDCQIHNDHLESLGCSEIPRALFIAALKL